MRLGDKLKFIYAEKINFEDTYDIKWVSDDLTSIIFSCPQQDGQLIELTVKITQHPEPLFFNVYNLGFGPADGKGGFLDYVRLSHQNIDKMFSTVLLFALTFLHSGKNLTIGVDGSDDRRARLYHLMFKHNRSYLEDFFVAIGVDWYVRIFRNGAYEQNRDGTYIAKPRPEKFDYVRPSKDLYRYYMFQKR
ncbi:DUF6934 family protein [Pedobacter sp. PWIIR3]